jgi:redox-sensitive bicupin YhaK (pirin superfamily)
MRVTRPTLRKRTTRSKYTKAVPLSDLEPQRAQKKLHEGKLAHSRFSSVSSVVVSGKPLEEPVAWYGTIVMNTQEPLQPAFKELEQGKFLK